MIRYNINPRQDYKEKIEKIGFNFHTDYWRENAFIVLHKLKLNK